MSRDWKKEPPETLEDGFQLAEQIAGDACEAIKKKTGEAVRHERRGNSIVIIWPDGEITNRIEVELIQ